MNKKSTFILVAVLILALVIGMTGCGGNGSNANGDSEGNGNDNDKVYTMRIGTGAAGGNPQVKFMEVFKEYAEEMADGKLEVQVYPAGQLGTLAQMVQSVQDGSVSGYLMPSNYYSAIVPEMEVFDVPGLFKNTGHMARVLMHNETSLTPKLIDAGFEPVTWVALNDFVFACNKEIKSINDFKGLKIWCNPGVAIQMQVEAFGMTPSLLDLGEVVSALQNNTIDAAMAGATFFAPVNVQDVADHLVMTPRMGTSSPFMVSTKYLASLPEELQSVIREAAKKANEEVVYDYCVNFEEECINTLAEKGMNVIYPEGDLKADIASLLDGVRDDYLASHPHMQDIYDEIKTLADSVE